MEQKTYWWRAGVLLFSGVLVALGLIYEKYFCFAYGSNECLLDSLRIVFFEPLFIFSISFLLISPVLFLFVIQFFLNGFDLPLFGF
jgi:hypothetical protein